MEIEKLKKENSNLKDCLKSQERELDKLRDNVTIIRQEELQKIKDELRVQMEENKELYQKLDRMDKDKRQRINIQTKEKPNTYTRNIGRVNPTDGKRVMDVETLDQSRVFS